MDDQTKPADIALATRIMRAAGIPSDAITAAAPTMLQKLEALDRQRAKDATPEGQEFRDKLTDPRELWTHHSALTLHRFFAGRCLTCRNWQQGKDDIGSCSVVTAYLGYKTPAPTEATWGCLLYAEIPVEDEKTITARTELAMALGLLQPYPGTDEAIEVKPVEASASKATPAKSAKKNG